MKRQQALVLSALLFLGVQRAFAQSPNDQQKPLTFRLTVESRLGVSDRSLVTRVQLAAPELPRGYGTRLKWRYPPHKSVLDWSGFARGDDQKQMSLEFVALTGQPSAGGYPPFFAMQALQRNKSGGGSNSSVFAPLEANGSTKVDGILKITVKDGEYPVNKWILIGTLADHPIYWAVCLPDTKKMEKSEQGSARQSTTRSESKSE